MAIVVDLRGSSTRKRGSNTRKQSRAAASVVHVDLLGAATKEPAISRNDASEGLDAVEGVRGWGSADRLWGGG